MKRRLATTRMSATNDDSFDSGGGGAEDRVTSSSPAGGTDDGSSSISRSTSPQASPDSTEGNDDAETVSAENPSFNALFGGLPHRDVTQSNLGGIVDGSAAMAVSLMTDNFGAAGMASKEYGVLPSRPGHHEVNANYFDGSRGGKITGKDVNKVAAYTGTVDTRGEAEEQHDVQGGEGHSTDQQIEGNTHASNPPIYAASSEAVAPLSEDEGEMVSDNIVTLRASITTHEDSLHSQPGVMFVPGPDYRGGIHTGYHSPHESENEDLENQIIIEDDDVENQIIIDAYAVPDENEQAETIDKLHEQLGSTIQELEVARSRLETPVVEGVPVPDEADGPMSNIVIRISNIDVSRKRLIIGFIVCLGAIAIAVGLAISFSKKNYNDEIPEAQAVAPVLLPVLEALRNRKVLRCGVEKYDRLGFISFNNDTNKREGFEVDLCKAVAAAALGSDYRYELIPTTGLNRFMKLANGEFDVIISGTTHTFDRDVHESSSGMGFSFSTPYLYGGMTFNGVPEFVKCADDLSAVGDCAGILICSILGTTWYDKTKELFPASNIVLVTDQLESIQYLTDGKCNVIQGEQYDAPEVVVRGYGYDGPYGQGKISFTKDPLAMVTRDGDPEFAVFVSFVIQTLFLAEKENITMMSADTFVQTQSVEAVTFAQTAQGIPFAQLAELSLSAVGNYGEIYTRHLAPISPRLEINEINNEETTGLLYSHPLGKVDTVGPGPIKGGVIERILQRGFLRCGISNRNYPNGIEDWLEARYDKSTLLHMEFCRALSASVLQRTPDNVSFESYSDDDDIYLALENGDIDVYAGGAVDVGSDFLLPGLAFSNPYFHRRGKSFALVTHEADVQWTDFVYWVTMSTIYAEENGITQNTSNEMPLVNLFGTDLERLLRDAILAVGNYDEMYRRVFGQNATREGLNMLNASPFGPQHYPYLY
eukprot:scaffold20690_cov155-Skeletonema_dohrnii-CCMP3373.AAC.4